jgi:hypothetical protein
VATTQEDKSMTIRIAYPLALAGALALAACGGEKAEQAATDQAAGEPTAASSEFVAENPTEPAFAAVGKRQRAELLLAAVRRAAAGWLAGLVFGLHRQDLSLGRPPDRPQ